MFMVVHLIAQYLLNIRILIFNGDNSDGRDEGADCCR